MANGRKADVLRDVPDNEIIDIFYAELCNIFLDAEKIIDRTNARIKRWDPVGLPPMIPGAYASREQLRTGHGNIVFCGDYTANPGLTGANNSGYHAALTVDQYLSDSDSPRSD
jgi:hypothetical protein